MIRALRHRHGLLVLGISAVVPLLVVLAIVMRPDPPIMRAAAPPPTTESWTSLEPAGQVSALIETDSSREWLHLVRNEAFAEPDVLVYWSPTGPGAEGLPEDAVLLGALGDTGRHAFDLPLGDASGTVFLYSLGHATIVGAVPVNAIRRLGGRR